MLLFNSLISLAILMHNLIEVLRQRLALSAPPQTASHHPPLCNLSRLPEELLLRIFELLDSPLETYTSGPRHGRSKNFACLCRVSKQFRRIATPLLYMSIDRGHPAIKFSKLMHTLAKQPELTQHIRRIRQRPIVNCNSHTSRIGRLIEEIKVGYRGTLVILLAVILQLPGPQDLVIRWQHREDILLALCAFQSPRLERLWVSPTAPKGNLSLDSLLLEGINRSILGCPFGNVHSFEHLRVLHLDFSSYSRFPTSHALPLLLLPRLEALTLGGWGKMSPKRYQDDEKLPQLENLWTWPCRESSIKKLALLYPWVDPAIASKMIRACKSLVRFECTNHCTPVGGRRGWYSHISAALLEHACTLQELSIGERSCELADFQRHGRLWCTPSLTNLRFLRAPYHVLAGHSSIRDFRSMVPGGISHLIVSIPNSLVSQENFQRVRARGTDGGFPNLALIELQQRPDTIHRSYGWTYASIWFYDKFRRLFAICEGTNCTPLRPRIIIDARHVRVYNSRLPWYFFNDVRECCAASIQHSRSRTNNHHFLYVTRVSTWAVEKIEEEIADDESHGY